MQRFEEKKKNLNLPNDYGVGDLNEGLLPNPRHEIHLLPCSAHSWHGCAEEHAAPEKIASMTHHRQAGVTTVVTTSAIAFDSDDMQDEEHSGSGSEDDRHEPLAVLAPATDSRTPKNVCSLNQKMILYLSVFSVTPKGMAAPLSRYSPDLVSQADCAPIMQMGAAANPVDRKGRSSKKRQSSADRLAKLKTNQGKSKPRGPRAPRKSKAGKGKPGKGKRS